MGPYGVENFEGFFFHLNLLIMSDRTVKYEDNVIQNYKLNFIKNINSCSDILNFHIFGFIRGGMSDKIHSMGKLHYRNT